MNRHPLAQRGGVSPRNLARDPLGNVPVVTEFWRRYSAGALTTLADFKEAVRLQRLTNDATNTTFERTFTKMDLGPFNYAAPARLAFPSHFNSPADLRQRERADWQHVDLDVKIFAAQLIEAFRKMNIPLWVHAAFRTKHEQDVAVAQGRSKAKWPRAPHAQGKAVDIVHGKFAWDLTPQEWLLIGKVGKDVLARINRQRLVKDRFNMEWGGDWRRGTNDIIGWDPAHWEKTDWRDNVRPFMAGDPVRLSPRKILSIQ